MEPQQSTDNDGGIQKRQAQEPARRQQDIARPVVRTIRCDVYENDTEYLVLAELPGLGRESCDVSVHDRELRIRAERGENDTREQFLRTFTLPFNADPAEVKATAREGVLRITIGKTRESQPRRIQIEG
jgi:HSP20 family protein